MLTHSSIPVPVGPTIGPPLGDWRSRTIESILSGTERSSHWRHEEDCDRHGVLSPTEEQDESTDVVCV